MVIKKNKKEDKEKNREQRMAITIAIFIVFVFIFTPAVWVSSASPLIEVPLDSWVYSAISRLETLRAFDSNTTIPTNTLPLSRIEVADLIDTTLFHLQRGTIELKARDLALVEKLVLEFEEELASLGVKVITESADESSSNSGYSYNSNSSSGSSSFPLPSSEAWLYEFLNYFAQPGNVFSSTLSSDSSDSSDSLNPEMSRKEMAILLDKMIYQLQTEQIPLSSLTDEDLEKLETLILELRAELSSQGLKIVRLNRTTVILDNLQSTLKINPYFIQRADFGHYDSGHYGYQDESSRLSSELGIKMAADFSEKGALYLDYSLNLEMNYPPVSSLTETNSIDLVYLPNTQLKEAYLTLQTSSWEVPLPSSYIPFFPTLSSFEFPALRLTLGRDSLRWGPAYQGSLILSDNAPPLDLLKYSGTIDLNDWGGNFGQVNFTKFFSLLDPLEGQNRYFLGQRLEYKPLETLTLGLSETAIISQGSSILFYNPLPFVPPYYATWWIASMLSPQEVNCNVALDMELNFLPGIKLYGEWMADDFIFFPEENPYPNRTGFIAGAYFADPLGLGNTDFRVEYTHINNYVYYPTHPWQDYLYQGEYIGHPLGPDADQLYLELIHGLSDKLNLSLSYNYERHGEGQVGVPLPSDPQVANENIFLSGIIEKDQTFKTEVSYNPSSQWELSASVILEKMENKDNTWGEKENNAYLQFEINYRF